MFREMEKVMFMKNSHFGDLYLKNLFSNHQKEIFVYHLYNQKGEEFLAHFINDENDEDNEKYLVASITEFEKRKLYKKELSVSEMEILFQ